MRRLEHASDEGGVGIGVVCGLRILVAVFVGTLLAGACWQNAARYFPLPSWHASQTLPASFWMRGNVHSVLALMAARSAKPAKPLARIPSVYPYSVVPEGRRGSPTISAMRRCATHEFAGITPTSISATPV